MRSEHLALGAGALALGLGLAAYPLLPGGAANPFLAALGAGAVLVAAAALLGLWPGGLGWSLGLLAAEWFAGLELRQAPLDLTSPVYAAAIFLFAELGWLALEARRGLRPWPARLAAVAALALGGAAIGWAVLAAAALPVAGGPALTALGVAAAVLVAAALGRLAKQARN